MITTDAWVLHAGPIGATTPPGELARETIRIPPQNDDEALVEPLYGSWEANMTHAIQRSPVDVCRQRGETSVVLGNSGVVRVLRPAKHYPSLSEGDLCLVMCTSQRDPHGYVERILAYDAPATFGLLATRTKIKSDQLLPLPPATKYPLPRWAPTLRYFTAWDNWQVAHGCWRTQMRHEDPADHLVFGYGGGAALAELILARHAGFRVAMTISTKRRAKVVEQHGITPVPRPVCSATDSGQADPSHDQLRCSERTFLDTVNALSNGLGVAIFLDNIGGPLHSTTLRSLARQGVLSTFGWKAGMKLTQVRASECITRHLHVHTHAWRHHDAHRIRDYQEDTGWLADIDPAAVYNFDDVPHLAKKYANGEEGAYFPLYRVNPL